MSFILHMSVLLLTVNSNILIILEKWFLVFQRIKIKIMIFYARVTIKSIAINSKILIWYKFMIKQKLGEYSFDDVLIVIQSVSHSFNNVI